MTVSLDMLDVPHRKDAGPMGHILKRKHHTQHHVGNGCQHRLRDRGLKIESWLFHFLVVQFWASDLISVKQSLIACLSHYIHGNITIQ